MHEDSVESFEPMTQRKGFRDYFHFLRGIRSCRPSCYGSNSSILRRHVLSGQLLSFSLAMAGALGSLLSFQCHISMPAFQAALMYLFLALVFWTLLWFQDHNGDNNDHNIDDNTDDNIEDHCNDNIRRETIANPTPRHYVLGRIPIYGSLRLYLLMAFLDVEANYAIILAYKYTTLTSISLLDALAIPSAMLCSILLLQRKYTRMHVVGVLTALLGMAIHVMTEYDVQKNKEVSHNDQNGHNDDDGGGWNHDDNDSYPFQIRGDVLAMVGSILYGLNDTLTEKVVKMRHGSQEYLAMLGILAFVLCAIQSLWLERVSIRKAFFWTVQKEEQQEQEDDLTCSQPYIVFLLLTNAFFGFLSYFGMSQFLLVSEAAFLNLNLLTGDLWAVLFVVWVQSVALSMQFWISFILIVVGVILYEYTSLSSNDVVAVPLYEYESASPHGDHPSITTPTILVAGHSRSIEHRMDDTAIEMK